MKIKWNYFIYKKSVVHYFFFTSVLFVLEKVFSFLKLFKNPVIYFDSALVFFVLYICYLNLSWITFCEEVGQGSNNFFFPILNDF